MIWCNTIAGYVKPRNAFGSDDIIYDGLRCVFWFFLFVLCVIRCKLHFIFHFKSDALIFDRCFLFSLSPIFGTYTSAAFEHISFDCTTIDKPFIQVEYFSGIKGDHYTKAMFFFLHLFRLPNSINMMICFISYFSVHMSMFFKMLVCVIIDALAYRSKAQWF